MREWNLIYEVRERAEMPAVSFGIFGTIFGARLNLAKKIPVAIVGAAAFATVWSGTTGPVPP